jgi:hypothetical protein
VAIECARKKLQAGKEKWRHLHHQRQALKHRVDASRQTTLLSSLAPTPTRSPSQGSCFAESEIQTFPRAVNGEAEPSTQPRQDSDFSKQSKNTLHHQLVQAIRHSRYKDRYASPSLKSISAFKHHAIVSFSALNKYMTTRSLGSSSHLNHQELRQAFLMCQTETAQRLDLPASRICWFIEWPYEPCPQQRLCTSFSAWSGACQLSTMVTRILVTLESMFLVMEHEHLCSAADPIFKRPKHPAFDSTAPSLPPKPQPPDAAALAAASVRCGVKELVQMKVALRRILPPLVRKFKGLLPHRVWLSVCIQCMRVAQTLVDAMRSIPNSSPQAGGMHATEARTDQDAQCSSEVCVSPCIVTATCVYGTFDQYQTLNLKAFFPFLLCACQS